MSIKLLERVKKKISNLRSYHEQTGEMNQEAFFAVSDYVTNSVPVIKLIQSMQRAADYMAGKGIGMIHSVSGVGFPLDLDMDLERWFASGLNNGIQMRVYVQLNDPTQSEQIVVSCSGWIGSFFACSPCVSRATGFSIPGTMCH